MCRRHNRPRSAPQRRRRGLTLIELLLAMVVMSIVMAALGMLAAAVQASNEYTQSHGVATQHARVTLGRIQQKVAAAAASEDFPGLAVFAESVDGFDFPDTLVVWAPDGAPANADGPPLFRELVIYCPDPAAPHRLLEITVPNDSRATPPLTSTSTWMSELAAIKSSNTATKTVLTDDLRTAPVSQLDDAPRGVVRFDERILPSQTDWASFQSGSLAWEDVPWAQDVYGASSGLRQSWCRIELQLVATGGGGVSGSDAAIPFFGSAVLYYDLQR